MIQTVDHPANRYLVYLLRRLDRVLRESASAFERFVGAQRGNDEAQAKAAHAASLAARLQHGRRRVRDALERSPLSEVDPRAPTAGAVQAVVDHPLYARIQRIVGRMLDPGVALDGERLGATLRPTYDLFELAVLYRLADALCALGDGEPEWGEAVERHLVLSPPTKTPLVRVQRGGTTLRLWFQPLFTSIKQAQNLGAGRRSLSRQRLPDYAVTEHRAGGLERWWCLDAKYRTSWPSVAEGLRDMHVYRDALRWDGKPASGGYIVVPHVDAVPEVAAGEYLAAHAFGAVASAPDALRALLTVALEAG